MIHFYISSIGRFIPILVIIVCNIAHNDACAQVNDPGDILIPENAEWRYQAYEGSIRQDWLDTEYNDAKWKTGKAGFGYGDDDDRTRLKQGSFKSLRIRHSFVVGLPKSIDNLYLYLRYDDAFIAYLNGHEIARSGIVEENGHPVVKEHEAEDYEKFSVENPHKILREGINVLAIEGFNRSITSSDFTLHPVLVTKEVSNPGLPLSITREEMLSDLKYLEKKLEEQSSYLLLNKFDYKKDFAELTNQLDQLTTPLMFARRIEKFIAKIGDGHAEVRLDLDAENDRYLPFVLANTVNGIVAMKPDQGSFLEEDYPVLTNIDGKPIQHWLNVAARFVAKGSPQMVHRESLLELRSIDRIRTEDAASISPYIDINLQSIDGSRQIERRLKTSEQRLSVGKLVLGDSKILDDNIGYLRISSMKKSKVGKVLSEMARLRDTDGLIIDVRGNRGGHYDILRTLYGYFIPENTPPYVSNIAAYRLSKHFEYDHLHYRPTYRLKYAGWTTRERRVIKEAMANFQPEWTPPKHKFSDWHYMVLGRSGDSQQFYYQKPVAVLSNAGSYSATDGFLSAFSDLHGVVIIGQPSSGASGATQHFMLLNSGIEIALSSMVSFRPNGKLFDGNGVEVDIPIEAAPGDFLGLSDVVLDKAIEWIKKTREEYQ